LWLLLAPPPPRLGGPRPRGGGLCQRGAAAAPARSTRGRAAADPCREDPHSGGAPQGNHPRDRAAAGAAPRRVELGAHARGCVPRPQIQEHYRVILDGFAVSLPERKLPTLLKLKDVDKVYPSLAYFATADRGPEVIDASQFEAQSGDAGQGMKIGVVDTGVDPTNPFLSPAGFSYPAGFPKGDT